jgi:MFS transporter, SP family, arabinose:H+ symporter
MMNKGKVLVWSIVVALGGLLFGLDTAVISGAEQSIQKLWNLDVFEHGLTVSIALIGTVFGALFGGIPTDRLGRKKTLFWIGVLYLISAVGAALAYSWGSFLFFRFIGGLGVGASSVAAPMYISEISPATHRGRLVALFQINIVLGILLAFLSNYLFRDAGDSAWRWMIGIVAIPSIVFLVLVLFVPESPRWLIIMKGDTEGAERIFSEVNPSKAKAEVDAILNSTRRDAENIGHHIFSKPYRQFTYLAFLFAFFNQVSGINAIIYYAPRIFEMAGLGKDSALLSSAGIGLINFIFTLLALSAIDRYGRRKLMLIGSVGLIITLGLVAYSFFVSDFSGYAVPVYIFLFIAFFAISQGAVIWVFISEIFPNNVRGQGQSFGSFVHWFMAAVVAFSFPYLSEILGGGNSFLIFMVIMVFQLVFVLKMMPETKGRSLEDNSFSRETAKSIEPMTANI